MILEDKMQEMLQDPLVFYEYYDQQYKQTIDTIEKLKKKGIPDINLIHFRTTLGHIAGKRAIAYGIIKKVPNTILISEWYKLKKWLPIADTGFKEIEDFEKFITRLEQKCVLIERNYDECTDVNEH